MPFVKLDTRILDSSLWGDREAREVFITALLMAEPSHFDKPLPQLEVNSFKETGFTLPPGWYGFIPAAGVGIVRKALIDEKTGLKALERLGSVDPESRSLEHEGRRLVRVPGGYVILNFMRFRDHDHSAAKRMKLLRQRRRVEKDEIPSNSTETSFSLGNNETVTANVPRTFPNSDGVQSAEAEADYRRIPPLTPQGGNAAPPLKESSKKESWKPEDFEIPLILRNGKFIAAWSAFIQLRKKAHRRAPLTLQACELLMRKLEADPRNAVAMLEQSIERGWFGLFPVKSQHDDRFGSRQNPTNQANRMVGSCNL